MSFEKYIVFKRSDYYEMMGMLALPPYRERPGEEGGKNAGTNWNCAPIAAYIEEISEKYELPDAVVIRRQDKFAPPALDAYANAIQCVLELVGDGVKMEIEKYARLQEIADYFHEQATRAWNEQRKLPD